MLSMATSTNILSLIEESFTSFKNKNILVVGDVMIDSYILGDVERISPEAPIPVINIKKEENRLGGAANVALNVLSLSAKPIMCSIIGEDKESDIFAELLKQNNITDKGIIKSNNRKTTVKTRVVANNQQLLRIDQEDIKPINKEEENLLIEKIREIIKTDDISAIIFEDYNKGCITENIIKEVINTAKENKIPTLVDPKKDNFFAYKGASLFKPNFKEFVEGIKIDLDKKDKERIIVEAQRFVNEQDIEILFLTLSEEGVFICNKKENYFISAKKRDIVDVSGAGDTVISVAALCLANNIPPQYIAEISNIAGGLVCQKAGVVPINLEELVIECKKHITNY